MLEMSLNLALNLALNHHWYLNLTNKMGRKAYLAEGNHRLAVAMSEGIPYLPVRHFRMAWTQWIRKLWNHSKSHSDIKHTWGITSPAFWTNSKINFMSEFDNAIPQFPPETCAGNHGNCMTCLEYVMHMMNTWSIQQPWFPVWKSHKGNSPLLRITFIQNREVVLETDNS